MKDFKVFIPFFEKLQSKAISELKISTPSFSRQWRQACKNYFNALHRWPRSTITEGLSAKKPPKIPRDVIGLTYLSLKDKEKFRSHFQKEQFKELQSFSIKHYGRRNTLIL